ncbi:MAG: fibronectin type III domain-containing protein [bacterium]|nr:fibronectin type III domain-containing protein [bacterium]
MKQFLTGLLMLALIAPSLPQSVNAQAAGCQPGARFSTITGLPCSTTTTPTQTTGASCLNITRTLSLGSVGADVTALQQFLRTRGHFNHPTNTSLYGAVTAVAVGAFQIVNGIAAARVVGPLTRAAISRLSCAGTTGTPGTPQPTQTTSVLLLRDLKLGSVGEDVRTYQRVLNRNAATRVALIGAGSPGFETTTFGPATLSATIRFQQLYQTFGIGEPLGIVGVKTRTKVNQLLQPSSGGSSSGGSSSGGGGGGGGSSQPQRYTINASAETGGSISPGGNVGVDRGDNQTFTITPSADYDIDVVLVDGVSVGNVATYMFSSVTGDRSVTAKFKRKTTTNPNQQTYTVTASSGSGGSISPSGTVSTNVNTTRTFTITPSTGKKISQVTVDGVNKGVVATYTFPSNTTGSHTIAATFAPITYTITATAGSNGSISPSGSVGVDHGTDKTFTITPNSGYKIAALTVNGGAQTINSTHTLTNITQNNTIAATFSVVPSTGDTTAPSVPSNLSTAVISDTQINLTWTASTDAVGVKEYRVFRNGVQVSVSTNTLFTNTGLTASTAYSYTVAAVDAAGNMSAQSAAKSATTLAPSVTSLFKINDRIEVKATGGINVRSSAGISSTNLLGSNPYLTKGTIIEGPIVSGGFTWWKINFDTGFDGWSGENNLRKLTTTTSDTEPPIEPKNLVAAVISSSQINLSWDASADNVGVTGYRIFRNGTQIAEQAARTYNNTGLTANTTYGYSVLAVDAAGNVSAQSLAVTATTQSGSSNPTPTTFKIGDRLESMVATNVRSTPAFGGSANLLGTNSVGTKGTVTEGPTQAGGYAWWKLNNDTGFDGWSTENNFKFAVTSTDTQAPSVPLNPLATVISNTEIKLSWSASTDNVGVTKYFVYRNGVQAGESTDTSHNITGLTAGTNYGFTIAAVDAAGNVSAKTPQVSATTSITPPPDDPDPTPPGPDPVSGPGWTTLTSSSDTKKIYVSNSSGSDSNNGSSNAPVKTLSKAYSLVRNGYPDWILLKKGDVWTNEGFTDWEHSGRSASEPVVITSYGSGTARPLIESGSKAGLMAYDSVYSPTKRVKNLSIVGIHFKGNYAQSGIRILTGESNILIEDIKIERYATNISITTQDSAQRIKNVTIRRSVIMDAFHLTEPSQRQGIYVNGADGLLIEENVVERNGWRVRNEGSVYAHDIYLAYNNTGVTVRKNIISRGASHGLQMRPGGIVEDNLFVGNPISMSYGVVNGINLKAGGVSGRVNNNVILEGSDITPNATRGWGMEISNIKAGTNTTVSNNLFAFNKSIRKGHAIQFTYPNPANPEDAVGVNDLTVSNNIVYDWGQGVYIAEQYIPGGSGIKRWNNVKFTNNQFQNLQYFITHEHGNTFNGAHESWTGNVYSHRNDFSYEGTTMLFEDWRSDIEPGIIVTGKNYAPRTLGQYSSSIGGSGTSDDFLLKARSQSRDSWDDDYTALKANAYIKAGFFGR